MGQWVGVKMSVNLRPALYEAVLGLLDPAEDLAVRLEAAQTLKTDILKLRICSYRSGFQHSFVKLCHKC